MTRIITGLIVGSIQPCLNHIIVPRPFIGSEEVRVYPSKLTPPPSELASPTVQTSKGPRPTDCGHLAVDVPSRFLQGFAIYSFRSQLQHRHRLTLSLIQSSMSSSHFSRDVEDARFVWLLVIAGQRDMAGSDDPAQILGYFGQKQKKISETEGRSVQFLILSVNRN